MVCVEGRRGGGNPEEGRRGGGVTKYSAMGALVKTEAGEGGG